jgi:hypothetical protein
MPRYIIERTIADAHLLTPADLQGIAQRSNATIMQLGPSVQWVQSYVSENRITCIYIAPNEEMIREHASRGGFPADRVAEVVAIFDPVTAEAGALIGAGS